MKQFLAAATALWMIAACAPQPQPLTGDALVVRGEYLVTGIGGCNDCHTPMAPTGPDMAHELQGTTLAFAPTIEMPWAPIAPPIAGIPAHYTEEQFATLLRTGERPDGSQPLPPMPQFRMNEDDARAITAYIATLPRAEATQ